jgi:hypothetical protein
LAHTVIVVLTYFCLSLFALPCAAAQERPNLNNDPTTEKQDQKSDTSTKPAASSKSVQGGKLTRWFELQTATIGTRYREAESSAHTITFNQIQYNEAFQGRFKFDAAGKYSVSAGAFTGNQFVASWDDTGIGTGKPLTNLYLKQLYFSMKPTVGIEAQYGGLHILRGESTEITSYDNDGYIVGERLSINRPRQLFFDELSITYAYLGDRNRPDIFARFHRLNESNYHQFLVRKKLGSRAIVSADYTFQDGTETLRQAIKVNTAELRLVDSFRFENYQRLDLKPDYGFAVSGEKAIGKRFNLTAGYAQIDPNYGGLNADRFNIGKRLYVVGAYSIIPEFTVSAYATQAIANDFGLANNHRFDLIFSYNLLKSLQHLGIFK